MTKTRLGKAAPAKKAASTSQPSASKQSGGRSLRSASQDEKNSSPSVAATSKRSKTITKSKLKVPEASSKKNSRSSQPKSSAQRSQGNGRASATGSQLSRPSSAAKSAGKRAQKKSDAVLDSKPPNAPKFVKGQKQEAQMKMQVMLKEDQQVMLVATDPEAKNFSVVNQSISLMNEDPSSIEASHKPELKGGSGAVKSNDKIQNTAANKHQTRAKKDSEPGRKSTGDSKIPSPQEPEKPDGPHDWKSYDPELIDLEIMQKFDMQMLIEQNMNTGNSAGDTALTRTTMERVIREALPMNQVRMNKDAIDLICHLANQFVHLIADIGNKVCQRQGRMLIFSEHMLRALQSLQLDEMMPLLMSAEQTSDELTTDVLQNLALDKLQLFKGNKHKMTASQVANEREEVVSKLMKYIHETQDKRKPRRKEPPANQLGKTDAQIAADQAALLAKADPSIAPDPNVQVQDMDDGNAENIQPYSEEWWANYKSNWLEFNRPTLFQKYEAWVQQHVSYNQQQQALVSNEGQITEPLITDLEAFKATYNQEYYCELEYNEWVNFNFYQQQQGEPNQAPDTGHVAQFAQPVEPDSTKANGQAAEANPSALERQKDLQKKREEVGKGLDFDGMEDDD